MDGKSGREVTGIPAGVRVHGEIVAGEDMNIHGEVDGQVTAPDHQISVASSARLKAKVLARTVTIAGTVEGSVTATDNVSILSGARVRGHIHTPSLTLIEGGILNGTVDPERTEAAMLVARYRQRQQE